MRPRTMSHIFRPSFEIDDETDRSGIRAGRQRSAVRSPRSGRRLQSGRFDGGCGAAVDRRRNGTRASHPHFGMRNGSDARSGPTTEDDPGRHGGRPSGETARRKRDEGVPSPRGISAGSLKLRGAASQSTGGLLRSAARFRSHSRELPACTPPARSSPPP